MKGVRVWGEAPSYMSVHESVLKLFYDADTVEGLTGRQQLISLEPGQNSAKVRKVSNSSSLCPLPRQVIYEPICLFRMQFPVPKSSSASLTFGTNLAFISWAFLEKPLRAESESF